MDLIWLASYPRSGNNWVRFLLSAYLYGPPQRWQDQNRTGSEIHFLLEEVRRRGTGLAGMAQILEATSARFPREAGLPSQSIVKTHFEHGLEHPLLEEGQRVIHLIRNPHDVALSGLNYRRFVAPGSSFSDEAYIEEFIERGGDPLWVKNGFGTWASHAASWVGQDRLPRLEVRYEDLAAGTARELRRMITFMGSVPDESRIGAAVEGTSAARLRELEHAAVSAGDFGAVDRSRWFINAAGPERAGVRSIAQIGEALAARFRSRFEDAMLRHGYAA